MFAAQLLHGGPDLSLQLAAGLSVIVWTVGIVSACWLVSKLPKRIAVMTVTAIVLSVAFARLSAAEVPGLDCCYWNPFLWFCWLC